MTFEAFWALLTRDLARRTLIRNWTRYHGYYGENFDAIAKGASVVCFLPRDKVMLVPKKHFARVFELWEGYFSGAVQRQEFFDKTFFSKYIISIIHQLLDDAA